MKNDWIWISGSNHSDQSGIYGKKGFPSRNNVAGARCSSTFWYDSNSKIFYLFGGDGVDAYNQEGFN